MIIRCPACNARYTLTARQIGEHGRSMKCAKCGETWFQPPIDEDEPTPVPKSPPPVAPAPSITENLKLPTDTPVLAGIAIILSTLVLAAALWWFLTDHDAPVPDNYSPVTFTRDGMSSEVHTDTGLVLSQIERDILNDGNVTILLFRGKVTNTNAVQTPVPEIRVQLLNHKGVELDFWPAEVAKQELEPGETATWVVRFLNPPLDDIAKYKAFFKTY